MRNDAKDDTLRQMAIQLIQKLSIEEVEDFLHQHGG